MTIISPLVHGANIPGSAHLQIGESPKQDFASILDGEKTMDADARSQTFEFSELGMFGRHGAISVLGSEQAAPVGSSKDGGGFAAGRASGTPLDAPVQSASDTGAPPVAVLSKEAGVAGTIFVQQPEVFASSDNLDGVASEYLAQAGQDESEIYPATVDMDTPPSSDPGETNLSVVGDAEPEETPSAGATSRWTETAQIAASPGQRGEDQNAVNVVVSGANEELNISVRSAGEDPEGAARIRAVVEETAAEFGLTVSEINLNGETVKTSQIPEGEESYGRRAR